MQETPGASGKVLMLIRWLWLHALAVLLFAAPVTEPWSPIELEAEGRSMHSMPRASS